MNNREIVINFLERYQKLITASEEEEDEMEEQYQVYNEPIGDLFDCIHYIVYRTNIASIPPMTPYFNFLNEIEEISDVKIFCRNPTYSFNYGINSLNGKVLVLDDEYDQVFLAAKSDLHFLKVLTSLIEYELETIQTGNYDENLKEGYLAKCIDEAGGPEFGDYYRLIL